MTIRMEKPLQCKAKMMHPFVKYKFVSLWGSCVLKMVQILLQTFFKISIVTFPVTSTITSFGHTVASAHGQRWDNLSCSVLLFAVRLIITCCNNKVVWWHIGFIEVAVPLVLVGFKLHGYLAKARSFVHRTQKLRATKQDTVARLRGQWLAFR